nr:DUF29 family protein [Salmonella enterica]
MEKSPSLKREQSEMDVESYGDAVLSAARETGLDEKSFPSEMPWALADTLCDDFNRIRAASRQGRDQTYGPEVF